MKRARNVANQNSIARESGRVIPTSTCKRNDENEILKHLLLLPLSELKPGMTGRMREEEGGWSSEFVLIGIGRKRDKKEDIMIFQVLHTMKRVTAN